MSAEMKPLPVPLPCPFCGETLVYKTDHHGDWWAHAAEPGPCHASIDQLFDEQDIAAWNRRAPPATQAWRAAPKRAPDDVIAAASEAGRRAFEIAKTLTINPGERQETAGRAFVHYAYLAGWRDAVAAPPGTDPAPPAQPALAEALRDTLGAIDYFLAYEDDRDPFRTHKDAVDRLREARAARAALAAAEAGRG